MSKPRIYLFTSQFPYGKQETFLEPEVKYLSEYFDITILPGRIDDRNMRPLDKKIVVDTRLATFGKKKRYHKRNGWMNISFWSFLWHEKNNLSSIQAFKRINTFAAEYSQTYNFLKLKHISAPCILYSYWLNGVALALADFKILNDGEDIKALSRAHGYDVYEDLYKPAFWPMRPKVIERLDKIFFVSNDGLEITQKKHSNKKKMGVNKLGIINPFQNSDLKNKPEPDVLKILTISNLVPVKRVPLIAMYLKRFANENPGLKIKWNHFGDGLERRKLDMELTDIPDNFNYSITERILNIELMDIISNENFDLFLNISLSEGLPVSMMEAISNGIPIVATNVGGVSEIVNEITGCLIPKNFDYETFQGAVKFVFQHISKNEERRLKITHFWNENYSAEKNYTLFANELMNL